MHKDKNSKNNIAEVHYCSAEGSNRVLIMQLLGILVTKALLWKTYMTPATENFR